MDTLNYIQQRFNLDLSSVDADHPIEIANTNRETLASVFAELGFLFGAEIGVEQGVYSEMLCQYNPTVKLYCIDAWTAYKGYRDHVTQEKLDGFYKITQDRLTHYNATLIKGFSCDVVSKFKDNSLDFVYIDGNHAYSYVVEDLFKWSKKVRPGGIIAGHDYIRRNPSNMNHVVDAVNGFTRSYRISPWFILGSKDKKEGELRDDSRSFFWVKQ